MIVLRRWFSILPVCPGWADIDGAPLPGDPLYGFPGELLAVFGLPFPAVGIVFAGGDDIQDEDGAVFEPVAVLAGAPACCCAAAICPSTHHAIAPIVKGTRRFIVMLLN